MSYIKLFAAHGVMFVNAIRKIPLTCLDGVNDDIILGQYKEFLSRLQERTDSMTLDDLMIEDP